MFTVSLLQKAVEQNDELNRRLQDMRDERNIMEESILQLNEDSDNVRRLEQKLARSEVGIKHRIALH